MKTIENYTQEEIYTQEEKEEIISFLEGNLDTYDQRIIELERLLVRVQEDLSQIRQWRHEVIMEAKQLGVDFTG